MVNRERVRLLAEALIAVNEDGTLVYRKGRGSLHWVINDTWCCLGVASDVAAKNGLAVPRRIGSDRCSEIFGTAETQSGSFLCQEVRDWYGFKDRNPVLRTRGGTCIAASCWNDSGPGSAFAPPEDFAEIAEAFLRTYDVPAS